MPKPVAWGFVDRLQVKGESFLKHVCALKAPPRLASRFTPQEVNHLGRASRPLLLEKEESWELMQGKLLPCEGDSCRFNWK